MIEVLQFMFAGFWRWCGSMIMLAIVCGGVWRFISLVISGRLERAAGKFQAKIKTGD